MLRLAFKCRLVHLELWLGLIYKWRVFQSLLFAQNSYNRLVWIINLPKPQLLKLNLFLVNKQLNILYRIKELILLILSNNQFAYDAEPLQTGHFEDFSSQGTMQSGWKKWWQGKTIIFWFFCIVSWQTGQFSSLLADSRIYSLSICYLVSPWA